VTDRRPDRPLASKTAARPHPPRSQDFFVANPLGFADCRFDSPPRAARPGPGWAERPRPRTPQPPVVRRGSPRPESEPSKAAEKIDAALHAAAGPRRGRGVPRRRRVPAARPSKPFRARHRPSVEFRPAFRRRAAHVVHGRARPFRPSILRPGFFVVSAPLAEGLFSHGACTTTPASSPDADRRPGQPTARCPLRPSRVVTTHRRPAGPPRPARSGPSAFLLFSPSRATCVAPTERVPSTVFLLAGVRFSGPGRRFGSPESPPPRRSG